jgi:dolichol-phosphate mannosyltransferase
MGSIVVVPTYNERDNLEELVTQIFLHLDDVHVLIVDDSSPDGTGQIADRLSWPYAGRLFVLHRPKKEGLGPAYLAGFAFALERGYEFILQMDGDLSHDPSHLPRLRERCRECDLVLGSRYLNGVAVVNWDFRRLLLSKAASRYARLVLRIPFSDPTGGFKCWRGPALRDLNLKQVFSNGYLFQIEMTYRAFRAGARIGESPIVFFERKVGRSKMNWKIILEAIFGVLRLRLSG